MTLTAIHATTTRVCPDEELRGTEEAREPLGRPPERITTPWPVHIGVLVIPLLSSGCAHLCLQRGTVAEHCIAATATTSATLRSGAMRRAKEIDIVDSQMVRQQ